MALIACRECGREISDQAPACLGCGAPVDADRVVTTQQTSKWWKSLQALGVIMIIVGMVGCIVDINFKGNPATSTWITSGGFLLYIVGRFFAWWNHG